MQVGDDDADDKTAQNSAETATSETADQDQEGQQQAQEGVQDAGEQEGDGGAAQGNALAEAAAAVQKPAKNPVKPFQARIDEITRARREEERQRIAAEDRAARAEARLAELERGATQGEDQQDRRQQVDTITPEMVDQLAQTKAEKIAADNQFDAECNRIHAKGSKDHEDFHEAMTTLGSLGGLDRAVIEDALATDAADEVLYALGKEPEEAMRILKLPRAKRIAEFTKMTIKAAPKPAPVSRAATPVRPVAGNVRQDFDFADASTDDAEWHRRMDEKERADRRARA